MPKKTKDQTIRELQESIAVYQSAVEKLSRENISAFKKELESLQGKYAEALTRERKNG